MKLLLYITLIFYLITSTFCEVVLQDLSDYVFNDKYGYYLSETSDEIQCTQEFTYLVTDLDATNQIRIESYSTNIIPITRDKNQTSLLFFFTFNFKNTDNRQFGFSINSGTNLNNFIIDSPCSGPPNTLDIQVYNENYSMMDYITDISSYSKLIPKFYFKITNFVKPLYTPSIAIYSNNSCINVGFYFVSSNIYQGHFSFSCTKDLFRYDLFEQDILVTVAINLRNQVNSSFVIHSYLKKTNNRLALTNYNSFEYYPRTSNNIVYNSRLYVFSTIENGQGYDLPIFNMLDVRNSNFMVTSTLVMRNKTNPIFLNDIPLGRGEGNITGFSISNDIIKTNTLLYYSILNQKPSTTYNNAQGFINDNNSLLGFNVNPNAFWLAYVSFLQVSPTFSIMTPSLPVSIPYGFINGNFNSYTFSIDYFVSPYLKGNFSLGLDSPQTSIVLNPLESDIITPKVISFETISIPGSIYEMIRMHITDDFSGFNKILQFGDYRNIVQGSVWDGVYDFIYPTGSVFLKSGLLQVVDFAYNYFDFFYYNYNLKLNVGNSNALRVSSISQFKFEFNDIDVSESSFFNRIFIYVNDTVPDYNLKPYIFEPDWTVRISPYKNWFGYWDYQLGCYVIPFEIKRNYASPTYDFSTYFEKNMVDGSYLKYLYGPDAELRIKSTFGDVIGPMVTNIEYPFGRLINVDSQVNTKIQWKLTIEDPFNGLKKGVITISNTLDTAKYNYTFTSWGETKKELLIDLTVNGKCKSQTFYISNVFLEDQSGYQTLYSIFGISQRDINPMMQVIIEDSLFIGSINTTCLYSEIDNNPPTLSLFKFQPDYLDVMYLGTQLVKSNMVIFTFEVIDQESGINLNSAPFIYLQDQGGNNILKEQSKLVNFNSTWASYQCEFEIPFGYGFPYGIRTSIYGIIDNQSNFNGYSSSSLSLNTFSNTINVNPVLTNHLTIIEAKELTSRGNDFIIYGRQFMASDVLIIDYLNGTQVTLSPTFTQSSVLAFKGVGLINEPLIHLTIRSINDVYSNTLLVYFEQPIPRPDEIPTNAPIPCLDNCGGPDHGTCTTNGCVCKSPWIDLSCSSQIIVIDPVMNNTSPSTTIVVPSNDKDTAVFYSIISVVGLNELDQNNTIVKSYSFPQWIVSNNTLSKYKEFTSTSYIYTTSLNNNNVTTNINVSIDYFNQVNPVNITFANQIFTMNPYSIKYSVNISDYSFSSSLNTLQLVLLASIESNGDQDQCSSSLFGDAVETNSEYFKMQVNDHSLYGRFIKRGIVDGRVKSIDNEPLDSQIKTIKSESKQQTYIGIKIPYFRKLVQLDPDFSVLVNTKSATKDSDNAICGDKKKSKLSGAQIAGIVIGCVAFTAIIVVSVTYAILKSKKQKAFQRKMERKLDVMNK